MTDPVAEKSTFLCLYMSNHPDTLVAYVKYWGKVKESVERARMVGIDSKGMDLKYKVKGGSTEKEEKEVRVSFDPPLVGYEEVKPRLLSMTADAQEALGMSKVPQITSFELTPSILTSGLPLLFLVYTSLSPSYVGPGWDLGKWLYASVGGAGTIRGIWTFVAVVHFFEALWVGRMCVKHRMGWSVGARYVLSTACLGFTVLVPLRKRIQQARIDSIMKVN